MGIEPGLVGKKTVTVTKRRPNMNAGVTITSVRFRNFKAFKDFSVSIEHMNILVGPNNSGKSTVIGAFRALAAGLQGAQARSPDRIPSRDGKFGYRVPSESIPISIENAQTDYQDIETTVTFRLSNRNQLILSFLPDDPNCYLIPEPTGRSIDSPKAFREAFPVSVGVVPVLGPVEHNEEVVQRQTVTRNLATHRASRNFRNYWRYNPEGFDAFRQTIRQTWPGMDITPPELSDDARKTAMFCLEDRMTRELYWTGFGFQAWCQLLTHIIRGQEASILVIDEPDIYLHPDLQRQLLSILRDAGPDILIATHSSELISEAEPTDILMVDKYQRSAKRVHGVQGIQGALELVGSVQNFALTQLARVRRALYVEGDDFRILGQFARRLGLAELAAGRDIAVFRLGGFPAPGQIRAMSDGITQALGLPVAFAGVFDRDFRSDDEVRAVRDDLAKVLRIVTVLTRKEIENYLLIPTVLERAVARALAEDSRRTGVTKPNYKAMAEILEEITNPMKSELQGQYIARRTEYLRNTPKDAATITKETIEDFEEKWNNLDRRIEIIAGKKTLGNLIGYLQLNYGVNLTHGKIIAAFDESEVPSDLGRLLRDLNAFRTADPNDCSPAQVGHGRQVR